MCYFYFLFDEILIARSFRKRSWWARTVKFSISCGPSDRRFAKVFCTERRQQCTKSVVIEMQIILFRFFQYISINGNLRDRWERGKISLHQRNFICTSVSADLVYCIDDSFLARSYFCEVIRMFGGSFIRKYISGTLRSGTAINNSNSASAINLKAVDPSHK